jgi:hypothetical protein
MTEFKKRINGFDVEVHLSYDKLGIDWSDCYITKGEYSGTLAFLEGNGFLIDSNDVELQVPVSTIETISKWAEAKGY